MQFWKKICPPTAAEQAPSPVTSHHFFFSFVRVPCIWHLSFFICYLTFDIWHLTFDIWHLTFDIWHEMILSNDIDTIPIHSLMESVVISAICVWLVTHSLSRNMGLRDASASKNIFILFTLHICLLVTETLNVS